MKTLSTLVCTLLLINCTTAQWQPTPGPYLSTNNISMDMEKVVVSNNNLCALINSQVYISYNSGTSWMYASTGLYVHSIAFADSEIFAGGNGIYYSNNYGSTYSPRSNGLPSSNRIDALHLNGNLLVAALDDFSTNITDVYYSTDKGNTWLLSNGLHDKMTQCFAEDGTKLYAGTWNGVYMSVDSGASWSFIGLNTTTIHSIATGGNRIFAAENTTGAEFYVSLNDGGSWTQIDSLPPIGSLTISNNYVYAGSYWIGAYRSDDDGATWGFINMPGGYMTLTSLASEGNNLYASSGDGYSYSANQGTSWYSPVHTYNLTIKSIISPSSHIITTAEYGNYNSSDNGNTWVRDLTIRHVVATNDSIVLSGGNGSIYRSFDFGNTWNYVYIIPGSPPITAIAFKDSVAFVATRDSGVFFSNNYGLNWAKKNNGLASLKINSLTFKDSIIAAGSNNAGIFISADSGANWSAANNGLPDTCIQSLASYNTGIYAGTKNYGIYKSIDNGINWIHLNTGAPDTNVMCLYTCGVNVFAGIRGRGFLMSPDNGVNWSAYNNGLFNYNFSAITENGTDIFVGCSGYYSNGGGVWRKSISELPLTLSVKSTAVSHRIICEGNSTSISVIAIGGTPPYSYLWNNGSQYSSITVTPAITTTYTLTITDINSDTTTAQVTITVKPTPITPSITQSNDTLYSTSANGNIWMRNNIIIFNETSDYFVCTQPGAYSAIVIENGCSSDTSNVIQVVGIEDPDTFNNFYIYPNPANEFLVINGIRNESVALYNSIGMLVKELKTENKINLSELKEGLYLIQVTDSMGKKIQSEKILIMR